MNYLCLIDGVVEFGSTSLHEFARYFVMYDEEITEATENGTLEILTVTACWSMCWCSHLR